MYKNSKVHTTKLNSSKKNYQANTLQSTHA